MLVTVNSFPNEVSLDTLQHIDYSGFEKCMRVNKAFNAIIKHTALDRVLFRSTTVIGKDSILKNSTFATLPVLRNAPHSEEFPSRRFSSASLTYTTTTIPLRTCFRTRWSINKQPRHYLCITPCRVQTEPEIESLHGVRIRQLYEAMCRIYEVPIRYHHFPTTPFVCS
jgi:hypothetical protein